MEIRCQIPAHQFDQESYITIITYWNVYSKVQTKQLAMHATNRMYSIAIYTNIKALFVDKQIRYVTGQNSYKRCCTLKKMHNRSSDFNESKIDITTFNISMFIAKSSYMLYQYICYNVSYECFLREIFDKKQGSMKIIWSFAQVN